MTNNPLNTSIPSPPITPTPTRRNYPPPPRIPRLIRRPLVHRDIDGNIITTEERPSTISSAISMTREYAVSTIRTNSINNLHQYNHNEKAVDLISTLKHEIDIKEEGTPPNNTNYVPLQFKIISQDDDRYSSNYSVENILKNDGSVYW